MTPGNNVTDTAGGFLAFLVQSLVKMANDPTNQKFFLPTFLAGLKINGNESLVPFNTQLNMGPVPSIETEVSGTVCNSGWAPLNNYNGAFACTVPVLNITAVSINGLNNAMVSGFQTYPPDAQLQYAVIFNATMNAYNDYGQLTFNPAAFYFDVTCESNDKQHQQDISSTGTFTAAVGAATLNVVLLLTLNDDLTATVTIPDSYTPAGGGAMPGLGIAFSQNNGLKISDVTLSGDNPMNQFNEMAINQAFGDPGTLETIQSLFNTKINDASIRTPVAQGIQDQFNSLINNLK